MGKKKKPSSWPIWATAGITLMFISVLLIDWERYPKADEVARYVVDQTTGAERVEITKIEYVDDEYYQGQIYQMKIYFSGGRVEESSTTIKKEDRRAVYPWHDYYQGMYRKDIEY